MLARIMTGGVLLAGSLFIGTAPASASDTAPPYPCWSVSGGTTCSAYNPADAAAYADQWVNGSNPNYPAFSDDCTNFVSQALFAGAHSWVGPVPPGVPSGTQVDDDAQWWVDAVANPFGYTYSWSVADDLWNFENQLVPVTYGTIHTYTTPDPYGQFWDWSAGSGVAVGGAFIPNSQMGAAAPKDFNGETLPMAAGDIVFYDWDYTGTSYDEGFFANHVAMIVSASGTDPVSGWTGPLIDEHTNDRQDAIWSLIPYNSQAQTTAAWWDTFYEDGAPVASVTSSQAMHAQRIAQTSPLAIRAATKTKALAPARAPAITTPANVATQHTYSGPMLLSGGVSLAQAAAARSAFQNAMIARQQVLVPPQSATTPVAQPPAGSVLQQMSTAGDRRLTALFTGPQLRREKTLLTAAQTADATSDIRVLGGGANGFHYSLIRRLPDGKIEVRGTVRAWQTFAQVQDGGRKVVPATPHNVLDVDATLTQTGTGWKVSSLNWAFAPGSEP